MNDVLQEFVVRERRESLSPLAKGATALDGRSPAELAESGFRVADLPTPMALLDVSAVENNVVVMSEWCRAQGVEIAPHGKTTMAPALWLRQIEAGAWGITIANEPQLHVALAAGVERIQVASPLGRLEAVDALRSALDDGRVAEAVIWVDSIETVELLAGAGTEVDVLVDIGAIGGRTGVRHAESVGHVARAVVAAPGMRLIGVAGYEGAIADVREDRARFEAYIDSLVAALETVTPLVDGGVATLSVGGSAGIAETVRLVRERLGERAPRIILRSGVYIAHDDGYYEKRREDALPLVAAMSVWSRVVSAPEPGLALLDAGRRDISYDQGMPIFLGAHRDGARLAVAGEVTALNDQHAFLRVAEGAPALRPGDLIELGVSHPCTTFDRWPVLLTVAGRGDARASILGAVRTYF